MGDSIDCESPLLAALSLQDMDVLEWQPWDRVATWLDAHTVAAECASASTTAVPAAGGAKARAGSTNGSNGVTAKAQDAAGAVLVQAHSSGRSSKSSSSTKQPPQPQPQCVANKDADAVPAAADGGEADFDAPDWWQESVKARLEEQRSEFQSSLWGRFKILTGLAAHRAALPV